MLATDIAEALDTTAALDGEEGDAVARRMTAECIRDLAAVAKAAETCMGSQPADMAIMQRNQERWHAALANCRTKGWL